MKTFRNPILALLAVLVLTGHTALAQIETLVAAVETAPINITLPASANGMLAFRPCDAECDAEYERVRLTPQTKFSIDGEALRFDDFRQEFALIRQSTDAYALVSFETKNNTVTSLAVSR